MRLMRLMTKVRTTVAGTDPDQPIEAGASTPEQQAARVAARSSATARQGNLGALLQGAGMGLGIVALAAGVAAHEVGQRMDASRQADFADTHAALVTGGTSSTRGVDSVLYMAHEELDGLRTRVVAAHVTQSVMGGTAVGQAAVALQLRAVRERLASLQVPSSAGSDSAFAAMVAGEVAYTRGAMQSVLRRMGEELAPEASAGTRREITALAQTLAGERAVTQVALADPVSAPVVAGRGLRP